MLEGGEGVNIETARGVGRGRRRLMLDRRDLKGELVNVGLWDCYAGLDGRGLMLDDWFKGEKGLNIGSEGLERGEEGEGMLDRRGIGRG